MSDDTPINDPGKLEENFNPDEVRKALINEAGNAVASVMKRNGWLLITVTQGDPVPTGGRSSQLNFISNMPTDVCGTVLNEVTRQFNSKAVIEQEL